MNAELLNETIIDGAQEVFENVGEEAMVEVVKNGSVLKTIVKGGAIVAVVVGVGYLGYKFVVKPLADKKKAKKEAQETVETSTENVNA